MTSPFFSLAPVSIASFAWIAVALAGCSKDESPDVAASASASPSAASAPFAPEAESPPPSPSIAPSASSAPRPAPASHKVPAASPAPSSSAKPAPTCGDEPLPLCPLAAWMKDHTSAAILAADYDALARSFDTIVGFAPTGYTNWASIAHDGADAARAQSLVGTKAACRGCHNQYKDRYKREMRDRPL